MTAVPKKVSFTTGEVAQYCGVNFRTVIRWIKRGELKAYQLPGRGDNRITLDDFVSFLEANKIAIPLELRGGSRNRILIVDDDLRMARSIRRVLKSSGFEIEIAQDGFQAGVQLPIFLPALMTLDLRMPGIDGFQVIKFVRECEPLRSLKILIISALSRAEIHSAVEAGANDALEKPFENRQLLEKVHQLLGIPNEKYLERKR